MGKPPPDYLIFTDLETTGLDTSTASILEAAMVVVETASLDVVRFWSVLVDPVGFSRVGPRPHPQRLCDDNAAYEMHLESGLVDDWRAATLTTWALQVQPDSNEMINLPGLAMLVAHTIGYTLGGGDGTASLAGASVHYDRDVLRAAFHGMPERAALDLLSHRLFDTSVLRTAMKAWGDEKLAAAADVADESQRPHRALDDCLASLEMARTFRGMLNSIALPPIGRRPVEDIELPESGP